VTSSPTKTAVRTTGPARTSPERNELLDHTTAKSSNTAITNRGKEALMKILSHAHAVPASGLPAGHTAFAGR
jgi:hypothetical protein